MIQTFTVLDVADNSGAKRVMCIRVMGGGNRRSASLGDIIIASVREAIPSGAVKDHEVVHAVVVRVAKEIRRADGSYIKFDDNSAVILSEEGLNPRGTRIFGPVARELRDRSFTKIISLAPDVV